MPNGCSYDEEPLFRLPQNGTMRVALAKYGALRQSAQLAQECAELNQAILKTIQHPDRRAQNESRIAEEAADVLICLGYLPLIYPEIEGEIQDWIKIKLWRLTELARGDGA